MLKKGREKADFITSFTLDVINLSLGLSPDLRCSDQTGDADDADPHSCLFNADTLLCKTILGAFLATAASHLFFFFFWELWILWKDCCCISSRLGVNSQQRTGIVTDADVRQARQCRSSAHLRRSLKLLATGIAESSEPNWSLWCSITTGPISHTQHKHWGDG